MHLILGGRYMGKRDYAMRLYGNFGHVCNLSRDDPEEIRAGLITSIHDGVKTLIARGVNPVDFMADRIDILRDCVITGDEICGGVVPADAFGRKWRDETGRLYQFLANEADIVDRVFAGLPLRLKPCTYSSTLTIH